MNFSEHFYNLKQNKSRPQNSRTNKKKNNIQFTVIYLINPQMCHINQYISNLASVIWQLKLWRKGMFKKNENNKTHLKMTSHHIKNIIYHIFIISNIENNIIEIFFRLALFIFLTLILCEEANTARKSYIRWVFFGWDFRLLLVCTSLVIFQYIGNKLHWILEMEPELNSVHFCQTFLSHCLNAFHIRRLCLIGGLISKSVQPYITHISVFIV